MNCFEWQNRSSDYLDGVLSTDLRSRSDEHLAGCEICGERYKHYRLILTSIAGQPRASLPNAIKKSPFSAGLPKLDLAHLGKSRWEMIPWYIRTTLEGTAIILLILLAISTGPKIRSFYERSVERSLNDFGDILTSDAPEKPAAPLVRGNAAPADTIAANAPVAAAGSDDFASGETGEESDDQAGGNASSDDSQELKVGSSEIWRFNLKSDSPREIRDEVIKILGEVGINSKTPGFGGTEAPGGIQFDLLVSPSTITALKKQLQKITPPPPAGLGDSPMAETFTWYKNKSRTPLPAGKTRVVIWLSQI